MGEKKKDKNDENIEFSHVRFFNPKGAPIINAYRLEAELISIESGETVGPPPPTPTPEPKTQQGKMMAQLAQGLTASSSNPVVPDVWSQSRGTDGGRLYHWTREEQDPWFPGTSMSSPKVESPDITVPSLWKITWWADRAGPVSITIKL